MLHTTFSFVIKGLQPDCRVIGHLPGEISMQFLVSFNQSSSQGNCGFDGYVNVVQGALTRISNAVGTVRIQWNSITRMQCYCKQLVFFKTYTDKKVRCSAQNSNVVCMMGADNKIPLERIEVR